MIEDGGRADLGRVLEAGRRAKGPLYDFLSPTKGLLSIYLENFGFRVWALKTSTTDTYKRAPVNFVCQV